ncbi:hypothetical protein [Bradyrhizobium sp. RT5a]|uniref:hypothetical protein n=1 Tax=Bradyrhizobium sp. RT5a TaxID=3156380 RepID=UPI00339A6BF9
MVYQLQSLGAGRLAMVGKLVAISLYCICDLAAGIGDLQAFAVGYYKARFYQIDVVKELVYDRMFRLVTHSIIPEMLLKIRDGRSPVGTDSELREDARLAELHIDHAVGRMIVT